MSIEHVVTDFALRSPTTSCGPRVVGSFYDMSFVKTSFIKKESSPTYPNFKIRVTGDLKKFDILKFHRTVHCGKSVFSDRT